MGGLIAHSFLASLGGDRDVSALITLGTPFRGSVKAAGILSTGKGAPLPLPHRRLRALAKTLPGLYDLLPSYHCIDERESFRCLEAGDIAALGGDRELARESLVRLAKLRSTPPLSVPLHAIVGVKQPTEQSLVLADGTATMHEYIGSEDPTRGLLRTDRRGDGTVFRDAATLSDTSPTYLPQGHGALPRSEEVLTHVDAVLTARALGPALGGHSLGLRVPDVLTAGQLCRISADFVDDPAAVFCRIVDTETGMEISRPRLRLQDGAHSADAPLPRPGIYRVEAKTGGFSAVTQLVMVTEPLGRTEEARAR
jgi:hypothetical protein